VAGIGGGVSEHVGDARQPRVRLLGGEPNGADRAGWVQPCGPPAAIRRPPQGPLDLLGPLANFPPSERSIGRPHHTSDRPGLPPRPL